MTNEAPVPPSVLWAQRKEDIFLTFSVECKEPTIKIDKESVYFKGINAQDKKSHEVTIQLYDNVNPDTSGFVNKGRCIEMVLRKEKKDAPYWPSLTKDKKKPHYLKVDFNKWKDEDDEEEDGGGNNYDLMDMLQSMGGGGAGDKADKPSFDDLEGDSDDENLPDLE
ncbi:hypothetical protein K1T71_006655 [Dendrolimus kikuchii]|uniref:Uncharacterized protein n=1 Tax=Dendrolimus kikuchii TaxID=765133 RepID=A0ACC1D1R8_9NEOP|nr:hypothetical protein K1T71_006655 [Dendrolimus kikuchii]